MLTLNCVKFFKLIDDGNAFNAVGGTRKVTHLHGEKSKHETYPD